MKKALAAGLVLLLILTGCKESGLVGNVSDYNEPEVKNEVNEYYENVVNSDSRPIAIMIDNDDSSAWPQAGLSDAYLIYEVIVEGGASRMMALFKSTETSLIGPVRSSRHYFLDYAMENDAIYTHAGWSPKAESDIYSLGINNINGLFYTKNSFWRDYSHTKSWHTLYTNIEKLTEIAEEKGYKTTTDIQNINMSPTEYDLNGEVANKIVVPYSGSYKVTYEYNSDTKTYDRTMRSTPHITQEDVRISPKNIIAIYVNNYALPGDSEGKRQEIDNIGSGNGYFFTNGKKIPITWEKASRNSKTYFKDQNGQEIVLNPGQTFINIVPKYLDITVE